MYLIELYILKMIQHTIRPLHFYFTTSKDLLCRQQNY